MNRKHNNSREVKEKNLTRGELLAVVYADIFDYPLKRSEARDWQIDSEGVKNNLKQLQFKRDSKNFRRQVAGEGEYVYLKSREGLLGLRARCEVISEEKRQLAEKWARMLQKVPSVKAIFLTGSVAVKNASEEADVDLMVITSFGQLWRTRLLIVGLLKIFGGYRGERKITNRVCPNIFLDEHWLRMSKRNLYVAHEILQAKCLFDRGGMEKEWLVANSWVGDYLPVIYVKREGQLSKSSSGNQIRVGRVSMLVERMAYLLQRKYMERRITEERVEKNLAFFHPRELSEEVSKKFVGKLKKLGIID